MWVRFTLILTNPKRWVAPEVAGKPHEPIAAVVRSRLGSDGIVVGDRPDTDGRFAVTLGYRFGLVLSGVTGGADLPVDPAPDVVGDDLATLVTAVIGAPEATDE